MVPRDVEAALDAQAEVRRAAPVGIPPVSGARTWPPLVVEAVAGAPVVTAGDLRARVKGDLASYAVTRHVAVLTDDDELP